MNLLRRVEKLEAARKKHGAAVEALLCKFDKMSDDEIDAALSRMTDAELDAVIAACGETLCDLSAMTDVELNRITLQTGKMEKADELDGGAKTD